MLYVIDGTGESDQSVYTENMRGGMCERIERLYRGRYFRGPTLLGRETFDIARTVHAAIKSDPCLRRYPLFLAGHSRGGAAVIDVAKQLKNDGIRIDAMFLFDAVDRTGLRSQVELIPRNVRRVFHARRDTAIRTYFEAGARSASDEFRACVARNRGNLAACEPSRKEAIRYRRLDDAMKLRMRASTGWHDPSSLLPSIDFGNCGIGLEGACTPDEVASEYEEKLFLGSHGAIGGSFIGGQDGRWRSETDRIRYATIVQHDRAAVASVWAWMEERFDRVQLDQHDKLVCDDAASNAGRSAPGGAPRSGFRQVK